MNKNKIFTFLLLSAVGSPTFAEGVIYKCTDANGEISYATEATSSRCERTNLAKVDKGNIINKPGIFTNNNNGNSSNNVAITVQNSEQVIRDQKRVVILQGELTQERTQLKTILEMISKADKNDVAQIGQLKKMEDTHRRNIASLEKELGVKGDVQLATKPTNNIPNGLPFNLPREASEVQLVEAPKPPSAPVIQQVQVQPPVTQQAQIQVQPTINQQAQSALNQQAKAPVIPQPGQLAPKAPYMIVNPASIAKALLNHNPVSQQAQAQSPAIPVAPVAKAPESATPNVPYVLINPNSITKTLPNAPVASVATEAQTQPIKSETIKEIKEPAAITNRSIKNRVTPQYYRLLP